jgi:Predicted membrane protein (DUF2142)
MGRARLALAAGLTVMAAALGVVLSRPPLTVAGTNGVRLTADAPSRAPTCQPGGTLPRGVTAIRLSLVANTGPSVSVRVVSGSTILTRGERASGWGVDETVTVPLEPVARAIPGVRVCVTLGPAAEVIYATGARVRTPAGAQVIRLRLEYLRPGSGSWLSLVPSIAHHMGLARAPSGTWVAYAVIAVMLAASALALRLVLREPRSVPRAGLTCALVAVLSAACWSVLTPPFQATDEPAHFAYVQYLAETGRLPTSAFAAFSPQEDVVLQDLHGLEVRWHPEVKTISSPAAERQLQQALAQPPPGVGPGGASVAASEPPLYYALEAIPYGLGSGGTLLDRLELMRLLSALMAGLTALFAFLFVRESLPGARWAWAVGGLGVALAPALGFTSGAVTPDAMLYAVCAAIFYCLARAFRRGLSPRLALAIGGAVAVGLLTKLNFVGLLPGVGLGLIVLGARGVRGDPAAPAPRRALGSLAIAPALAASPVCVYALRNLLEHRPTLGIVSSELHSLSGWSSAFGEIGYIWQIYLPRLPGMVSHFPGLSAPQLWFDRSVGLYGWLDTSFPVWLERLALIPAALIAILALRGLIARRTALRARMSELFVYATMAVGLMALIGTFSYLGHTEGPGYAQPRYLMPLLALGAGVLVLAARGAGRRWGPAAGTLIVVLFLAQDVFSQLLLVARFYG